LIDLFVAWIIVVGTIRISGSRFVLQSVLLLWIVAAVVWVLIETVLMLFWGASPGKWVLGIRIESMGGGKGEGGKANFWRTLDRSFTVFSLGLGCLVPGISILCGAVAWQDLSQSGTTRWDRGKFRVTYDALGFARIVAAIAVMIVLLFCVALVQI